MQLPKLRTGCTGFLGIVLTVTALLAARPACAQQPLKPGFDPTEYLHLLEIARQQSKGHFPDADSPATTRPRVSAIPEPRDYHLVFRSGELGLYNEWELWEKNDASLAAVCIRGTVPNTASWMENFYAAMVPATGSLRLNDSTIFPYRLAEIPEATVHTGWLLGLAVLAPSIVGEIRHLAQQGVRQFILFGHSQGGAIAFLLTSYLHYLPDTIMPEGITFKTYCSAAPKPGNLQYSYDFDHITEGGWALRVVNQRDWVPETPFSLQTLQDYNSPNPFQHITSQLKGSGLGVRLYAGHLFNRLRRSSARGNRKFRKTLGHTVYRQVHRMLPGFREPAYAHSLNYMVTGSPVILVPYPGYRKAFPDSGRNDFVHHGLLPYYELVKHAYPAAKP